MKIFVEGKVLHGMMLNVQAHVRIVERVRQTTDVAIRRI
jgi:hypothetical protein